MRGMTSFAIFRPIRKLSISGRCNNCPTHHATFLSYVKSWWSSFIKEFLPAFSYFMIHWKNNWKVDVKCDDQGDHDSHFFFQIKGSSVLFMPPFLDRFCEDMFLIHDDAHGRLGFQSDLSGDLVKVVAPLFCDRNLISDGDKAVEVNVGVHDLIRVSRLSDHLGKRIRHQAVTPSHIVGLLIPGRADGRHVHLVVDGSAPGEQFPVSFAGGHVERSGVHEQFAFMVPGVNLGQVGEPDVVADADADPAVGGIERGHRVSWRKHFRFLKGDFSRNVDIEEMHLPVLGDQLPVGDHTVDVLNSFPVASLSGMDPPIRNTSFSNAMDFRAKQLSPSGIDSAYSPKYFVPYGELKHSGRDTTLAPFFTASLTFSAARCRLTTLLAPTDN